MKKYIILLCTILTLNVAMAKAKTTCSTNSFSDNSCTHSIERYKLYPTENIYNFLLLDTKTGKIEIVQWALEKNKEFSVTLNDEDLSFISSENGTFELYPTKNIYQFILLDKVNGRRWHVQWGFEATKRWIKRIY